MKVVRKHDGSVVVTVTQEELMDLIAAKVDSGSNGQTCLEGVERRFIIGSRRQQLPELIEAVYRP